ncbi:MAG: tRNA pseudouridine(55) synthase TruB [Thermoleophilia bacterium]
MNRTETTTPATVLTPTCGVLLVDKPVGPTSHDMVYMVRRLLGIKKVGHGGTLDPFASGVLLMLVGKATRLFDLLAPLQKEYRVRLRFGHTSTTGDIDGEITPRPDAATVSASQLEALLPEFTGAISQRPHRYSAVKVGGEPLYRKARRGEDVQAAPREVVVHSLEVTDFDAAAQEAELLVACSKGTYIRSLVEDIGERLGAGAYATALRRTRVGSFADSDASSPEKLQAIPGPQQLTAGNPAFISCLGALYFLPVRQVDDIDARAVLTGRPLPGRTGTPLRIEYQGRLLAVYGPAQAADTDLLRPLLVLA